AYVVNSCAFTGCPADVTVIDVANGTTVATVPVGDPSTGLGNFNPRAVTVAPDGKHAYVTCGCFSAPPSNGSSGRHAPLVSVIDTTTNAVTQVYGPLDLTNYTDQGASGLAITPDGSHVYVVGFIGQF